MKPRKVHAAAALELRAQGYDLVGVIELPTPLGSYFYRSEQIEKKHPGAKSFPGGRATWFGTKATEAQPLLPLSPT